MNNKQEKWEFCNIETQIIDDGRDPGRGGHKLMWLQFRARVDETGKIIDRSEKIPLANMVGANAYAPRKSDLGHQNTLKIFLQKLQDDGWELLTGGGGDWWQRRLRRVEAPSSSLVDKLKDLL